MITKNISKLSFFIFIALFSFSYILYTAINGRETIMIEGQPSSLIKRDTININSSSKLIINENDQVIINHPKYLAQLLGNENGPFFNCLDLFFEGLASVIIIFTFWNFTYERPFTKKTLLGFRLITFCLFGYYTSNIFRNQYIINYVESVTGKSFTSRADHEFIYFIFLGALFIRLSKIFNKGNKLQQEQDLTV